MDVIVVVGETAVLAQDWGGSYLLRLQVNADLQVCFGRFRGGQAVAVPMGTYVYVGSALGGLGPRLLRHASRRQYETQTIYPQLWAYFQEQGALRPGWQPQPKTLRWHVDYLLEETAVSLTHLLAIRSQRPLEKYLARLLLADAAVRPLAASLGASDNPGQTHLLRVPDALAWWSGLLDWVG